MDSEEDYPSQARIPTLEDLTRLCSDLNARGAKYIVIGGMAVLQHGFVRATEDIDLLLESSRENERKVIDALCQLEDQAAKEIEPGDIEKYQVIRVADEIVVDLMKVATGIEYAEASKNILRIKINGVEIPFADIELMIKLKQGARPKDKMDLEFFQALKKKKKV